MGKGAANRDTPNTISLSKDILLTEIAGVYQQWKTSTPKLDGQRRFEIKN